MFMQVLTVLSIELIFFFIYPRICLIIGSRSENRDQTFSLDIYKTVEFNTSLQFHVFHRCSNMFSNIIPL